MRCAIQRSVLATLISVAVAAPAWADSGEMLATARAVLAEAIELGDNDAIAKAQIAIGNIHYRGLGVSRDIGEAVKWYLEAAEAGDAEAQYYVGSISYVGDYSAPGPSWDVDSPHSFRGLGWIQSAAEQGYVGAQLMLGQIFSEGARGVPTDSAEAVKWYRGAADQRGRQRKSTAHTKRLPQRIRTFSSSHLHAIGSGRLSLPISRHVRRRSHELSWSRSLGAAQARPP